MLAWFETPVWITPLVTINLVTSRQCFIAAYYDSMMQVALWLSRACSWPPSWQSRDAYHTHDTALYHTQVHANPSTYQNQCMHATHTATQPHRQNDTQISHRDASTFHTAIQTQSTGTRMDRGVDTLTYRRAAVQLHTGICSSRLLSFIPPSTLPPSFPASVGRPTIRRTKSWARDQLVLLDFWARARTNGMSVRRRRLSGIATTRTACPR